MKNFGEKLKGLREERNLSQKELAQKTGLSIGSIQGYEQGRYNPKLEAIVKIAGALGVDLKVFYDDLSKENIELKRYENACFCLVNFPDSEEITKKYEKLRKKLIDRLSCM